MQVLKEGIRDAIIGSAELLFAENGYDETSINQISRKAGISKGNMYLYFKSKEELFTHVFPPSLPSQISDLIIQRINAVMSPLSKGDSHKEAGRLLIDFLINNRLKLLIMLNERNSIILGPVRNKIIEESCEGFNRFHLSISSTPLNISQKLLLSILYNNLISMIGEVLIVNRNVEEYKLMLEFLLQYHYCGIITFSHQP